MEKRKVKFNKDSQSALLWLMSHRNDRLYDAYGRWLMHAYGSNSIDVFYWVPENEKDPESKEGYEDFDRMSYEDFISEFKDEVLESKTE